MKKMTTLTFLLALLLACACARAEIYPLQVSIEGRSVTVAEIAAPEGLRIAPELAMPGETPEYYFVPADGQGALRFIYYTASSGEPRALAEAARDSYAMFYDGFECSEIREGPLAGRDGLCFEYTCQYPDSSGKRLVYEQTAVGYWPLEDGHFIACIVSLAFDDAESYKSVQEMFDALETAMADLKLL